MAQIPVKKIRIAIPKSELGLLVSLLQHHGCTEPILETEDGITTHDGASVPATTHRIACEEALAFLAPYYNTSFFRTLFEGGRAYTTHTEMDSLASTQPVAPLLTHITALQQEKGLILSEERRIHEALHELAEWRRLELPLDIATETTHAKIVALRGSKKALAAFAAESANGTDLDMHTDFFPVSETTALLIVHKPYWETCMRVLDVHGVEIVSLPSYAHTAEEAYTAHLAARAALQKRTESLEAEISAYANIHYTALQKHTELARWQEAQAHCAMQTPHSERVAWYTAWIPENTQVSLEKELQNTIKESAMETVDHETDANVPVVLHNNTLVSPFQVITNLYGVPSTRDIDPTPYLAPFFFVFFAICLGDVGYGTFLMLATGTVLARYHVASSMRTMLRLLFFGGAGSCIAGIFFGGYLGIDPATIHPFLEHMQQFDPIANPLPVFFLSLGLGFVHVFVGIVLNMVRQLHAKEPADALLDNIPWLYMFAVAGAYILTMAQILPEYTTHFIPYLALTGVAFLILTQGRKKKGIFAKAFFGILSLYGAVGYFADILSYSRLLALGLATGALAFSINLIAEFVGGAVPVVGGLVLVLILLLGHGLNITISVLGAFINSARLQFVEFFSKFVTGTGTVFTPFTLSEHNIIILPEKREH
jgi:V/A-type H+/Na+-transporting ATPase subunit I